MTNSPLLFLALATITSPSLAQGSAAPAKGPQPVSRTVYMQRVDDSFTALDTNKDGFADRAELEAAEKRTFEERKELLIKQREAAFRQMDKNKDGALSLQEYSAPLEAQAIPKANATPLLTRLDTNKDGKISPAENRAPLAARFDKMDSNKDGILSVEEQKVRQRR